MTKEQLKEKYDVPKYELVESEELHLIVESKELYLIAKAAWIEGNPEKYEEILSAPNE